MNDAYRPPTSTVADPPAARLAPRPWSIAIALLLIGVAVVDAGSHLVRGDIFDIAGRILWIVTLVFVAWMLQRRRNWARWVLLFFSGWNLLRLALMLAVPNVPEGVRYIPDYVAVARELAVASGLILGTVLVFGPGRRWFTTSD